MWLMTLLYGTTDSYQPSIISLSFRFREGGTITDNYCRRSLPEQVRVCKELFSLE